MPNVGDVTPDAILTVAGASLIVTILVEIILRAWNPTGPQRARFGPLLALGVGVIVVVGVAATQGADIVQAALTGILAGSGAMGIHDVVTGVSTPT